MGRAAGSAIAGGVMPGPPPGPHGSVERCSPPALVWEGDFTGVHSFAHVNREMVLALLRKGVAVRPAPTPGPAPVHAIAPTSALAPSLAGAPDAPPHHAEGDRACPLSWCRYEPVRAAMGPLKLGWGTSPDVGGATAVHVRHMWPPDFRRPHVCERFVLILPWEYGCLPSAWVGPVAENVDEVWAYSRHVRNCYVRSGITPEKVAVVHPGVDPLLFHPEAPWVPIPTTRGYRFLFVGGAATSRKGFDVLLRAYVRAFRRSDDVSLVVKDYFYGPVEGVIAAVRADPDAPEVVYLYGEADPWMMPGYYTACDCLVLPYRAEGFGLPALEAMACGKPVIVTGHGAGLDFCSPDVAYLIPARESVFPENRVGDFPTCGPPVWAEPDEGELCRLLRHMFTHREEAAAKGRLARSRVVAGFTWEHAAAEVIRRLGG